MKNFATQAQAYLDTNLASIGGAGPGIGNLVANFTVSSPYNLSPVNLGQKMNPRANHGSGSATCHISVSVPLYCVTVRLLGLEPILFSNAKIAYVEPSIPTPCPPLERLSLKPPGNPTASFIRHGPGLTR
jgi:hypothetical protein